MPFCPIGHMMILQGGEGKFKNDSGCIKYVLFYGFVLPILFSNVASSHQVFFSFLKLLQSTLFTYLTVGF